LGCHRRLERVAIRDLMVTRAPLGADSVGLLVELRKPCAYARAFAVRTVVAEATWTGTGR